MKTFKEQYIIDASKMKSNIYTFKTHQVSRFYEHASKELGIKHIKDDKRHKFYYKGKLFGRINGLKPMTTSNSAFIICKDKIKTERLLGSYEIPILDSQFFSETEKESAMEYIRKSNIDRFVIKPISLAGGKGIELNVDAESFSHSWDKSLKVQKELGVENPSFIVQRYLDGFDLRIAVTEGIYSSALLRIPAHIVGDGLKTIKQLIEEKNLSREKSIYYQRFLYKLDHNLEETLSKKNLTISSVLNKEQLLFISDLGNLTAGAESIDVTDTISKELIDIALRATAAIPGLRTAGVDILTEDFTSDVGFVSEVNTNANHQVHHMPLKGEVRKPFKDIIHGMLIRYKLESGIVLNKEEIVKAAQLMKFIKYKEFYFNNTYRKFMIEKINK